MDFWRTLVVLVRRWYITVPALLGALALSAAAFTSAPVEYRSTSILVLTAPLKGGTASTASQTPDPLTNPLLNFDQSLAEAASIVIQQMNSSDTASFLGIRPGGTTTYQVTNGSSNPELLETGPFVFVQGDGRTPEAAQAVTEMASAMAEQILAQRQTELGAPESTQIEIQVVVPPTAGEPLGTSRRRAAAAVGALAGLAALASAYAFESLMTHRRRRRTERDRSAEIDTWLAGVGRDGDDRQRARVRVPVGSVAVLTARRE